MIRISTADGSTFILIAMPPKPKPRAPLTKDQEQIFEENYKLVADVLVHVRPTLPMHIGSDELLTAGLEGLADAARRYSREVGTPFPKYAYSRVRGAMIDYVRRTQAFKETAVAGFKAHESLADKRARGEMGTQTYTRLAAKLTGQRPIHLLSMEAAVHVAAGGPSPETSVHARRLAQRLRDAVSALATQERKIIDLIDFQGKTLEEAGKAMGWDKSWTKRYHDNVVKVLQAMLHDKDG